MRTLIAIVFGCVLVIGLTQSASRDARAAAPTPATELSYPADDGTDDAVDDAAGYICQYSPRCQRAAQCTAYCAGGIPVCFQGCCSCAS